MGSGGSGMGGGCGGCQGRQCHRSGGLRGKRSGWSGWRRRRTTSGSTTLGSTTGVCTLGSTLATGVHGEHAPTLLTWPTILSLKRAAAFSSYYYNTLWSTNDADRTALFRDPVKSRGGKLLSHVTCSNVEGSNSFSIYITMSLS